MNYKILLIGLVFIISIIGITFVIVDMDKDINVNIFSNTEKIVSADLNYKQLTWNNVQLEDSTVYNSITNTCTASRYGMQITIDNCLAQDADGKDIEQDVKFKWTGGTTKNISWIFVYDQQLDSGSISALRNTSRIVPKERNSYVNNYLVDKVTSYINLTQAPAYCDLGNLNNSRYYRVNRTTNNATQYSQIVCFSDITIVNSTAFRISGNADILQDTLVYENKYVDVTNQINFLGNGLLNDNRSYYKVTGVEFSPNEIIDTKWIYTSKNKSKSGKWHILGYETSTGFINAINSNQYIYIDPWWSASWSKKKAIYLNVTFATENQTSTLINVTYDADMQTDFDDLRFLDSSESTELGYWFYNNTYLTSNSVQVWVNTSTLTSSSNKTIYMYYGNAGASTTSNIDKAFIFADDFNGTSVDFTSKWTSTNQGLYNVANGILNLTGTATTTQLLCSTPTFSSDYIVQTRSASIDTTAGNSLYHMPSRPTRTYGVDFADTNTNQFRVQMNPSEVKGGSASSNVFYKYTQQVPVSGTANWTVQSDTNTYLFSSSQSLTQYSGYICYLEYTAGYKGSIDWMFARRLLTSEPIVTFGSETDSDITYPIFTDEYLNPANNTQYSPTTNYLFNITISKTNGTAGLSFNNVNYSMTNSSNNFTKILTGITNGTYPYYFWSYGNGSSTLYNSTTLSYYTISPSTALGIDIVLLVPTNNTYSNKKSPQYNWTVNATNGNLTNTTIYTYQMRLGSPNWIPFEQYTWSLSGITDLRSHMAVTQFAIGNINEFDWRQFWNVSACASNSTTYLCTNSVLYNYKYDGINPNITIISQSTIYPTLITGLNITLNYSITDFSLSSCWLVYGGVNSTLPCTGTNASGISSFIYDGINRSITIWAIDTATNVVNNSFTLNSIYQINNVTYSSSVFENTVNDLILNISYNNTYITSATATIYYNDTAYSSTKTGSGTDAIYTTSLTTPFVSTNTNISFYWTLQMYNGTGYEYYNTSIYNQTIVNLAIDDCTTGTYKIINFTSYDEDTLNRLLIPTYNQTYELELYLNNVLTYYGNKSSVNQYVICSNAQITGNLTMDLQIRYDADSSGTDYVSEYYNIQSFNLNSYTTNRNVSLYDLLSTSSEECLFTIKDENFLPLDDALVEITRKYLSDGTFKTVEIPKTDSLGKTIGHFVLNDEIYSIYLRRNGNLLATFSNVKAVKPTGSDCTFNINIPSASSTPEDFTAYGDLLYDTNYTDSTRTYEIDWLTNSGDSSNVTLYAYVEGVKVCTSEITASSGTSQCIFSSAYQNKTARLVLYNAGSVVQEDYISIGYKRINLNPIRYVVAAALIPMLVLMGGSSIAIATVFFVIGVILSGGLALFDTQTLIGTGSFVMWIVIGAAILMFKYLRSRSNG